MTDGSGAASMQPALVGSAVIKGDSKQLIRVLLQGPAAVLPADRPKYSNVMPAFPMVSDTNAADLLSYLRSTFGEGASPVTKEEVSAVRRSLKP
jgi:mono/diheme cytochrome c family protein